LQVIPKLLCNELFLSPCKIERTDFQLVNVYKGNVSEPKTLSEMLCYLEKGGSSSAGNKPTVVMDAGDCHRRQYRLAQEASVSR
jgi:hypothetical protein